jgi:HEPN domain-containing protein
MTKDYKLFLELASEDLSASKHLFKGRYYPQSVFYLSQAVEKTCKYLLLKDNILTIYQLNKIIKHDSTKVFSIFTEYLINQISKGINKQKIEESKDDPSLNDILNPVTFINDLKRGIKDFEKSKNTLPPFSKAQIDYYLGLLSLFESNTLSNSKYSKFFKSEPEKVVKWITDFHIIDEKSKNDLKILEQNETSRKQFYDEIKDKLELVLRYVRIQQILMTLALLFSSSAVDSRYPDNSLKYLPTSRYNRSTPIIENFKSFYHYLQISITFLKDNEI